MGALLRALGVVIALVALGFIVIQYPEQCSTVTYKCYDFVVHYEGLIMFLLYLLGAQLFFTKVIKASGSKAIAYSVLAGISATAITYAQGFSLAYVFFPLLAVIPLCGAAALILGIPAYLFRTKEKPAPAPGAPGQYPPGMHGMPKIPKIPMSADFISLLLVYLLAMYMFNAYATGITIGFAVAYISTKIPILSGLTSGWVKRIVNLVILLFVVGFVAWEADSSYIGFIPDKAETSLKNIYTGIHNAPILKDAIKWAKDKTGFGQTPDQPAKVEKETIAGREFKALRNFAEAKAQARELLNLRGSGQEVGKINARLNKIKQQFPRVFV